MIQANVGPLRTITGHLPSIGALIGNQGSMDVLDQINSRYDSSLFNADFSSSRNYFFSNFVYPMITASKQISNTIAATMGEDKIVDLTSLGAFREIPMSMHLPILLYPPVRELFEAGRIDGFGYFPEDLPEEDLYGRLMDNGYIGDLEGAVSPETSRVTFSWTINSDDPDIPFDDLDRLRRTREFLDYILKETDLDPTNIECFRT